MTFLLAQDFVGRSADRFSHFEFTNQVILHPLGLAALVVSCAMIFMLRRARVIVPVIVLLALIPSAQRIMVGSVDFQFLRIVGLVALLRAIARGELQSIRWRAVDLVMLIFVVVPIFFVFPRGASHALMNTIGQGFDLFSVYLIGRIFIYDRATWSLFAWTMFLVAIPTVIAFSIEKATARNLFSIFGGVPAITALREGKLRAQGAFAHPILAGVWWAAMLPVFWSMCRACSTRGRGQLMAWVGTPLALVLGILTASSTPIGGAMAAIGMWCIFGYRKILVDMRYLILFGALAIHFVTESGLHGLLLTRITLVSGSTGFHRYLLINAAMERIPEWFLFGTNSTYHWGWGLDDVTCQYVAAAVTGGMVCLASLIFLLVSGVRSAWRIGAAPGAEEWQRWLSWGLVVSIVVHAICFIAVTYFGEVVFLFGCTIGAAATLSDRLARPVVRTAGVKPVVTRARDGEPVQRAVS